MDLILIRHPAVAVPGGLCYGRSDVPLAGDPHAAAEAVFERLAALGAPAPDFIESSPRSRCLRVAEALARVHRAGPRVREDARLAELDFGAWELRAWDAIERGELDAWAADFLHARAHGGESVAQFDARVREWREALPETRSEEACTRWVVSHAGVMRALAAQMLGLPLEQCMRWPLGYAAVVWLRRDAGAGRWALAHWNV